MCSEEKEKQQKKYSGLLIVDLLNPDFRNFFKRYAVDIIGFLAISFIVFLIIWITKTVI